MLPVKIFHEVHPDAWSLQVHVRKRKKISKLLGHWCFARIAGNDEHFVMLLLLMLYLITLLLFSVHCLTSSWSNFTGVPWLCEIVVVLKISWGKFQRRLHRAVFHVNRVGGLSIVLGCCWDLWGLPCREGCSRQILHDKVEHRVCLLSCELNLHLPWNSFIQ